MASSNDYIDKIGLVFVLYNPTYAQLENIGRIANLYYGAIVDNSDYRNFDTDMVGKMHYLPQMENTGIAHAQNTGGGKLLQNKNLQYLIFFDQDSKINEDMPLRLTEEFADIKNKLNAVGKKLALLGPTMILRQGADMQFNPEVNKNELLLPNFKPCGIMLSSGSCISRQAWNEVGQFDSAMFIDDVDHEWCFRAQAKGYLIGETPDVVMEHELGKNMKDLPFGHKMMIWSPIRYYYMYRNTIYLCRLKHTPIQWLKGHCIYRIKEMIKLPLFADNKLATTKYMLKGIWDGIRGKTGRIDGKQFA